MKRTAVMVLNKEEWELAQKKAFGLGFRWWDGGLMEAPPTTFPIYLGVPGLLGGDIELGWDKNRSTYQIHEYEFVSVCEFVGPRQMTFTFMEDIDA